MEPTYLHLDGGRRPAVLGLLYGNRFEQVVVDAELGDAALAKGLRLSSLPREIEGLLHQLASGPSTIFCFGAQTRQSLGKHAEIIQSRVFDAADAIAEAYAARRQGGQLPRLTRAEATSYARALGLTTTRTSSRAVNNRRLRDVREMIRRRGGHAALTGTTKGKWTKLLMANEEECRALQIITRELLLVMPKKQ